jgi:hypothetical protein
MDNFPVYVALRSKSRLMWLMRQALILALALFSSLVGIWQLQPVRAAGEYIFFAETEGDYLFKRRDLPGGGNEVTIYTTQYIDKVISEVVTAVVVDPDSNKLYYAVPTAITIPVALFNLIWMAAAPLASEQAKCAH